MALQAMNEQEKKNPIWKHRKVSLEEALERLLESTKRKEEDQSTYEMVLVLQARLNSFTNALHDVLRDAEYRIPNNAYGIRDFLQKLAWSTPVKEESVQYSIGAMRTALYEISREKTPLQECYDEGFEAGYRSALQKTKEAAQDDAHLSHIDLE
jgi:hypothetical protein